MVEHELPELDARGLRNFAFTFGGAVAVLFGLFFPLLLSIPLPAWPWLLFGLMAMWGLAAPLTLRSFYRAWMKFGFALSKITGPIILGIFYFGVLTPTALIARLFRSDPLRRKPDTEAESFRVDSTEKPRRHMERPF